MQKPKTKIIPATPEMWQEVAGVSRDDPGYTVSELIGILGLSRGTVKYKILPKLIEEGKCVEGIGTRYAENGHRFTAAVYELKKSCKK